MHKTKQELLEYQAELADIKACDKLTPDDKGFMIAALANSFNNGIELPEDSPEADRLYDLIELLTAEV
jgi:hypothetical protein